MKDFLGTRSIFIYSLPFFINVFINDVFILSVLLGFLFFLIDIFYFKKIKNKSISAIISLILVVSLYSFETYNDTFYVVHKLRFRYFILIYSIVLLIFISLVEKFEIYSFTNIFLIIFSITFIFNLGNFSGDSEQSQYLKKLKYKNQYEHVNKTNDPLVLIILDELSSSSEIFEYTKNINDLLLLSEYEKEGFLIFDDFNSQSMNTQFSLPSILNFNLHENSEELRNIDHDHIISNKALQEFYRLFRNNILYDSLRKKSITTNSFSLFEIYNSDINGLSVNPWDPRNINERFLNIFKYSNQLNTIINLTLIKFLYLKLNPNTHDQIYSNHNLEVLRSISDATFQTNNFYYFHLLAPHTPFYLKNEFEKSTYDENNFDEHLSIYSSYRRYILKRLLNILIDKKENVRFIITGDHGFRAFPKKINQYSTLLITKGYQYHEIKQYRNVQDLGYLINNSFCK